MTTRLTFILLSLFLLINPVLAQDVEQNIPPGEATLNEEQHQEINSILTQLKLLDSLPKTKETIEARDRLLGEASQITGTQATTAQVQLVYDLGYTSWSKKLGSYFSFINVLWVFVGLILLIAFLGLFGQYLWPLIELFPPELIELVAWIACLTAAFVSPSYWSPVPSFIAALISIPFFVGLTAGRVDSWRFGLAIVTVFIGAAAVVHGSVFFGTISVATLMWVCGSCFVPFIEEFSLFHERQYVPSTLTTSGIMLSVTAGLGLTTNPEWLGLFQYGVFWLAGAAFAGSLLTLSCRYYYGPNQNWLNWFFWQVVAVSCGIGALYVGHVYAGQLDSTVLQEIGGTFLAIYLIEKVCELPWDFDHWPIIALIIGIGGYYAVDFAASHPAYFLAF